MVEFLQLKSLAVIITDIQDTLGGNTTDFTDAILTKKIAEGLQEFSQYSPFIVRETLTTTEDSKELDISGIHNLLWIDSLEYKVDKTPRQFRNFTEHYRQTISMGINFWPGDADTVYLYCAKAHRVLTITDLPGLVDDDYDAGESTIGVNSYGATDVLVTDSIFTIVEDTTGTVYRLTEDSTMSGGAGDITFAPALAENISNGSTTRFARSTLNPQLESLLIDLVAARATISVSTKLMLLINKGGVSVGKEMKRWGQEHLALVLQKLEGIAGSYQQPVEDLPSST